MVRVDCRVCGEKIHSVLELGELHYCGYFPSPGETVPKAPVGLSQCSNCNLVQMGYDYDIPQYGDHYGYKSSLNSSMVRHLKNLALDAWFAADACGEDIVVDIGGNDGTLLHALPKCNKIIIDPSSSEVHGMKVVKDYFSKEQYWNVATKKARIVFSIAMFYDLDDPVQFARDIANILDSDGMWVFEQSYLPSMLAMNAFDTICHEHLEYYTLADIKNILYRAGLKIVEATTNDCNGGSIRIYAMHGSGNIEFEEPQVTANDFKDLQTRMDVCRSALELKPGFAAYGASTKGNTLLQVWGLNPLYIVDINPDKWGKTTPTGVPIVAPMETKNEQFLVLPWHFKQHILKKERELLKNNSLIFPLPFPEEYGLDTSKSSKAVWTHSAAQN